MMKLTFPGPGFGYSLHNHSSWSDGSSSPEEMCRAAKEAGLTVFGLSDHWVVPPVEGLKSEEWSMDLTKLDAYVELLQNLRRELEDDSFSLKIGLEVDFFFENYQEVLKHLDSYPLDYRIGSVHYAGRFPVDHSIRNWVGLTQEEIAQICEEYYRKLEGAAACKEFTFIGHLDLPKKFGFVDNEKYFPHALRVLDALSRSGGAIELNTAGMFKECKEVYPSGAILREACKRHIPVVVNADAHHRDHVTRYFSESKELLKSISYDLP